MYESAKRRLLDPRVVPGGIRLGPQHSVIDTSIIIPTRNEAANVEAVLDRIADGTSASAIEVLFVDDSDDETPAIIRSRAHSLPFPVHVLHRKAGERQGGLNFGAPHQSGTKV